MNGYLWNAWYVAAWSEELSDKPVARRILDTAVVLYRRSGGQATALLDRCPHRFAPLSMGKVDGDQLVCGYHGLRLDPDGTCVDSRLAKNARAAACVRRFPLEERDGILWIWMGDADRADTGQIQDYAFLADDRNRTVRGSMVVEANYFLEVENLLDLSHLDYLHLGSIANGGLTTGTFKADQEGDCVISTWESPDCPVPPQFKRFFPQQERVDQWTHFRWYAPATLYLYNGVTLPGQAKSAGLEIHQGHFVTPVSEKRCMYFWSVAQRKEYLPEEAALPTREIIARVFEQEDRPMIEAQQATMRGVDFWSEKPVLFPEDGAAVRARKILERLIREEQQSAMRDDALHVPPLGMPS